MTCTWNPSDKTSDIALTGGNLIATTTINTNTPGGCRATFSRDSSLGGQYMLSFTSVAFGTVDQFDYVGLGLASATLGVANGNLIETILTREGKSYSGNGSSSIAYTDFSTINSATSIDLAVDFGNMVYWYRLNGGAWGGTGGGDPGTPGSGRTLDAGGIFYPICRVTNNPSTVTLNPNPGGLPAGYAPWYSTPTISSSLLIG
jgi:hypothetical protein